MTSTRVFPISFRRKSGLPCLLVSSLHHPTNCRVQTKTQKIKNKGTDVSCFRHPNTQKLCSPPVFHSPPHEFPPHPNTRTSHTHNTSPSFFANQLPLLLSISSPLPRARISRAHHTLTDNTIRILTSVDRSRRGGCGASPPTSPTCPCTPSRIGRAIYSPNHVYTP